MDRQRLEETLDFEVGWHCDADFADIQEAQGTLRQQQAPIQIHRGDGLLAFDYKHDRLPYRSEVRFANTHRWRVSARHASSPMRLAPQDSVTIALTVVPSDADGLLPAEDQAERERLLATWHAQSSNISAPQS